MSKFQSRYHFLPGSIAKLVALFSCLILFSCSDQGCIDADDFGEYESQTVTVEANASSVGCDFDSSKDITDPGQGANIKSCLIDTRTKTFTDSNNSDVNSITGCPGFSDAVARQFCIDDCVDKCKRNSDESEDGAEPNWTATSQKESGRNNGVTIKPGSQISIRAFGTINLGDKLQFSDLFVDAKQPLAHSKKINSNDPYFLDVKAGQALAIDFAGRWKDGADVGGNSAVNNIGAVPVSTGSNDAAFSIDTNVINGGRRLLAYLIPAPNGYDYDPNQTTEKARAKGVLLRPERNVWECSYSGADLLSATCANKTCDSGNPYSAQGYVNSAGESKVDCELTNGTFPITAAQESTDLGRYGGMIRWSRDGLLPENDDPFIGINCSNAASCNTAVGSIPAERGRRIGSIDAQDFDYTNNTLSSTDPYAQRITFKLLTSSPDAAVCNDLSVVVRNAAGSDLYSYSGFNSPANPLLISNSSWSLPITLEPGYKLHIERNNESFGAPAVNCGDVIAMKIDRYHDIEIKNSGFVSFSILDKNPVRTSQSCNIKARIINKEGGSYTDYNSSYRADFYEYDDFRAAPSTDPLANLSVLNTGWTQDVFVRKGQYIRFSPESWNQNWNSESGARKCGIGMAMYITLRPAVLCKGRQSDKVLDPNCIPKYDGATVVGCQPTESKCSIPDSPEYCVAACNTSGCTTSFECKSTLSCSNHTPLAGEDDLKKQDCTITAPGAPPAGVTCPSTCGTRPITAINKSGCDAAMYNSATMSAYTRINDLDQCYDLENYNGKVANIPVSGFTEAELNNSAIAKGAVKIGVFNGYYGNFENLIDSGRNDTLLNNRIFTVRSPYSFATSGRLQFMVVDGSEFKTIKNEDGPYSNNGSVASSSTPTGFIGDNGFKIMPSTFLQFQNGQWLEAQICEDQGNDVRNCELNPTPIDGQSVIVRIADSSSLTVTPQITDDSAYRFDVYGNIVKKGAGVAPADCTATNNGVALLDGSLFYCHTRYYYPDTASDSVKSENNAKIAKLRLTFKIKDPEVNNCIISTGSTNCGTSAGQTACNGIKLPNQIYDKTSSANVGATCALGAGELPYGNVPEGKVSCTKQFYCTSRYSNNSGRYQVVVRMKSPGSAKISGIIGQVITPIIEVMDGKPATATEPAVKGQAERMYRLLISDARYKTIITLSLVLMFSFYGLGYLIGVSELNHSEIIGRIIKIGLIYLMIGETGWQWFEKFFVQLFKNGTDYLAFTMASAFDNSPEIMQAIANNDFYDKSILFGSADRVFGLFFSDAVQKKISALLFASLFGWVYLIIIYYAFMSYVYAICNAVLIYLTAQVFISILFTLGPIFFIFILFNQTKDMFDNWLKQLISFSLQQIFLLTTLAFFNMLMYEVIKMSLGYKICWDEVWTISFITRISLLSFWTIASMPPRTTAVTDVANIGNPEGIPSIFSILYIWVIASLMNKFVTFMSGVAASIGGGISASDLGSGIKAAASGIKDSVGKYADKAWDASGRQMVRRLDKALFDSGQMAKQHRLEAKKKDEADSKNKSAMSDAGKDAISKYKKEHGAELAGMDKEKQREKLTEIRNAAMDKAGKDLGLSDADIKRLKSDTGVHYRGSNIVGFAGKALKESIMGGRTLTTSIADKKVKTKFSAGEAKAAMKNTDEEGRKKFVEAVQSGQVRVGKLMKSKVADGAKAVAVPTAKLAAATVVTTAKTAHTVAIRPMIAMAKAAGNVTAGAVKAAWNRDKSHLRAGAAAARENMRELGRDTKRDVVSALRSGAAAAASGYGAAKSKVQSIGADRREAIRQLKKSGDIDKGNIPYRARTKEERKAIDDRVAANRKDRKVDTKMNDARTVRRLREVADLEGDKAQAGSTSRVRAEGSVGARIFGREKSLKVSMKSAVQYHTDGAGYAAAARDPLKQGLRSRVDEQLAQASQQRSTLDESRAQHVAKLQTLQPQYNALAQSLQTASKAFKDAPTDANRQSLEAARKAFQDSPVRAGINKARQAIHDHDAKIDSVQDRLDRLRGAQMDMDKSSTIRDIAQREGDKAVVDKYNGIRDVEGFRRFRADHEGEFSSRIAAEEAARAAPPPTPSAPPAPPAGVP